MLSDQSQQTSVGIIATDIIATSTFIDELLAFIQAELPIWQARKERSIETSETVLTSQLCAHLNSAARRSSGWDILQFRVEEPDESAKGRKLDLVPAPCDATVWIAGRRYVDFDSLLPIECKRLPTPKDGGRDEREYVFSGMSSTGGIQRFKAGHHGGMHQRGVIIGYVQSGAFSAWAATIDKWICALADAGQEGWARSDALVPEADDGRVATLSSQHARMGGLSEFKLKHLWIQMH